MHINNTLQLNTMCVGLLLRNFSLLIEWLHACIQMAVLKFSKCRAAKTLQVLWYARNIELAASIKDHHLWHLPMTTWLLSTNPISPVFKCFTFHHPTGSLQRSIKKSCSTNCLLLFQRYIVYFSYSFGN